MKAGLIRRGCALIIDLFVAVMPAVLIAAVPGVIVPLDRYLGVGLAISVPVIGGAFAYFFLGVAALPNTYGRYVMRVRVQEVGTGDRPTWGQTALRALTIGLWPIEALFILFSESKRRLGDRLARTEVVPYDTSRIWWKRLAPGVVGIAAAYTLLYAMVPLVNSRMTITDAAREYVSEELGTKVEGAPRQIHILDQEGTVTLRLTDARGLRLTLADMEHGWEVEKWEEIASQDIGSWSYSVQRGGSSASAGLGGASFQMQ